MSRESDYKLCSTRRGFVCNSSTELRFDKMLGDKESNSESGWFCARYGLKKFFAERKWDSRSSVGNNNGTSAVINFCLKRNSWVFVGMARASVERVSGKYGNDLCEGEGVSYEWE